MAKNKNFSQERFFRTLKISLVVQIGAGFIIYLIWLIFNFERPFQFPLAAFTLGSGGIFLTAAGCVGPGRYRKQYDLVLFSPKDGSSFSEEIPISGFTVIENIDKSDIMINDRKVGVLPFIDSFGSTVIPRDSFIEQTINTIWLDYDGKQSNKSYFTLFDYTDDLTPSEIDEFIEIEEQQKNLDVIAAKESYMKKRFSYLGSASWGLFAASIISFTFGFIFDAIRLS